MGKSGLERESSRWRNPHVWGSWIAFAGFALLVLWLGGADYSSAKTSQWVRDLIRFFHPEITTTEIYRLNLFLRKSMHVAEYGLLALLAFRAVRLSLDAVLVVVAALALLLALAVATADESRQAFISTRTGSPYDVLLDTAGAVAAVSLATLLTRYRRRRAMPDGAA